MYTNEILPALTTVLWSSLNCRILEYKDNIFRRQVVPGMLGVSVPSKTSINSNLHVA